MFVSEIVVRGQQRQSCAGLSNARTTPWGVCIRTPTPGVGRGLVCNGSLHRYRIFQARYPTTTPLTEGVVGVVRCHQFSPLDSTRTAPSLPTTYCWCRDPFPIVRGVLWGGVACAYSYRSARCGNCIEERVRACGWYSSSTRSCRATTLRARSCDVPTPGNVAVLGSWVGSWRPKSAPIADDGVAF